MCVPASGRVLRLAGEEAVVWVDGARRRVALGGVRARAGDYLLVTGRVAVRRLTAREAASLRRAARAAEGRAHA